VRKIALITVGSVVLLIGLVMVVTPGPALVLIPAGLAILAREVPLARLPLSWFARLFMRSWHRYRQHGVRRAWRKFWRDARTATRRRRRGGITGGGRRVADYAECLAGRRHSAAASTEDVAGDSSRQLK
jgi:hypothetical protein